MWQRIQTLFLVIAALAALAFLFVPICVVNDITITGKNNTIATSVAIAIALLSVFIISQYKDRKLQMRFTLINALITIVLAVLSFLAASEGSPRFEFALGVPVFILIALLLAYRNIKKDEDLVKSMDRFR
jgi:FtsH-binding integral membrane protein